MTEILGAGAQKIRSVTVAPAQTIAFMGEDARVYSTPALIKDIEHACRDLIFENTPEGMDSVGSRVSILHMAPTLLGMDVEITVTIASVKGPRVVFDVSARDPLDEICKGTHERFVVDLEKTKARLRAKAEKVANL